MFSIVKLAYNAYCYVNKKYILNLMIGESKENQNAASKISFHNKVKFIFYVCGNALSLIFVLLELLDYITGKSGSSNTKSLLYSFRFM